MTSIRKTATDIADRFFQRGLEPERHASLVKAITDAIHTDRMNSILAKQRRRAVEPDPIMRAIDLG